MKRLAVFIACIAPLWAHHSTAAFDMTRSSTVTGTVTKFYWVNPHSYIDLEDVDGRHWRLEIEALNLLRRYGWTKESLKPGDQISCIGAPAKDPAASVQKCFTVEFPDGRKLTATPSGN
ncbi:MAG TPA: DUF6152 family protein [Bryobacteraceae bacterium]